MPITVTMPALSPTMTEGNLAIWHVKEGDAVNSGDVIAEIETDKATMEVEAVDEGIVGKILVAAGTEGVAVNTPIAVLLEEGESAADIAAAPAAPAPTPEPVAAPAAPVPAPAPQPNASAAAPPTTGTRIVASPLAKRLAREGGLDLAGVTGSGPHGRIVKRDVEAALAAGPVAAPLDAAPAAAPAPAPAATGLDAYEEVRVSTMRKTIARRLTEAKRDIPHFYLTVNVELDSLLELRKQVNAKSPEGAGAYKVSVNDFIIKATGLALKRHPDCNASWADTAIHRFKNVDVAVAVAIDGGLITPIVRNADQKGLATIANEMKDLAGRARAGKLAPEEYQGGGFSISNLGMFGISEFSAVINPPHAGILAIGAGEQRPVIVDGAVQVRTMMSVTLSCDHRVIDGAMGAQLLQTFKGFVEDPLTMIL